MNEESKVKTLRANHTNAVVKIVSSPYIKEKTESGIFLPNGLHESQETGNIEKSLEQIIAYGTVINTGPDCKFLKEGDEIMVDTRSLRPVPFENKGYSVINEANVLCKIE